MLMKRIFLQTLAVISIIILISSCQYKFIVEPVIPPVDPGDTTVPKVSFSAEVEPIFVDRACTGCHNGSQPPDLRTGYAYSSITTLGLVDTADPSASKIYYYPLPDGNHYAKYTSTDAATVLLWIGQGALDN